MNYEEFVEQVQNLARIGSFGETEVAVQATLETLSTQISPEVASQVAQQLPPEVGQFLRIQNEKSTSKLSVQQFYRRVSEKEHVEPPEAAHHAQAVMSIVNLVVPSEELNTLRRNLAEDYNELLPMVSAG